VLRDVTVLAAIIAVTIGSVHRRLLDDQRPSVGISADATLASVSTSVGAPDDTSRPPLSSTQWLTRQATSKSWVAATIVVPEAASLRSRCVTRSVASASSPVVDSSSSTNRCLLG
jgi:hypothetical protein